jgi:hypothetical protein
MKYYAQVGEKPQEYSIIADGKMLAELFQN